MLGDAEIIAPGQPDARHAELGSVSHEDGEVGHHLCAGDDAGREYQVIRFVDQPEYSDDVDEAGHDLAPGDHPHALQPLVGAGEPDR